MKPRTALTLAAIVATLALPFALGGALHVGGWHPATGGAHGHLIEPPRPLPAAGLVAADGKPLATAALHGRWWLLLAGRGACADDCQRRVDEMRRIHSALGHDMPRLKRLLLTDGTDDSTAALRASQPDLVVAHPDAAWRDVLDAEGLHYFVVDPQARVMMRYPIDAPAAAVHADLAMLLRHSSAG